MRDPMFSAGFVGSTISTPPQNVVALYSSSVTMTCGISGDLDDDSLVWQHFRTTIYNSTSGFISDSSKYEIDDDYSLTIEDLMFGDGGQYSCQLDNEGRKRSAHVIVICKY